MNKAYKILAGVIAVEVVLQAMFIVFAVAGLFHWINDEGGSLDASVVKSWESDPPTWTGAIGHFLHSTNGQFLIPLLALALLILSFFAKVAGGTKWAAIVLGLVVIQVILGLTADSLPALGLLHGLNAFLLFAGAGYASRRVGSTAKIAEPVPAM